MTLHEKLPTTVTIDAKPYGFTFDLRHTALLVIDMQRDFLLPGGLGEIEGGNLDAVQASIAPTKALLDICRRVGMPVIHTREGHVPSLADCPTNKFIRQAAAPGNTQHVMGVGDEGDMGRLLIRGEYCHDFIDELRPLPSEVVIDKPGRGAFWNTSIMHKLKARGITHILVSGVTTECCFSTTIREANDRGFECCAIANATAGYDVAFYQSSLDMICYSQGLFGFVAELQPLLDALSPFLRTLGDISTSSEDPPPWDGKLDIASLRKSYAAGVSPLEVVEAVYARIEKYKSVDPAVWIRLQPKEKVLAAARQLMQVDRSRMPVLFGVPFSVKDLINVKGEETTSGCPVTTFVASESAPCFEKVIKEGALYFGKVNLDQLATSMNGCRSPYGNPHSVSSKDYIAGGSSSGSAVSVGADLVSFSLGTDTAGSGRVPSALNGIVGYKPTRGLISCRGLTCACRTLDTVALMTKTIDDARTLWQVCEGYDEDDPYSRDSFPAERHVNSIGPQRESFRFGIPPPEVLEICSQKYRTMFQETVKKLQDMGGQLMPLDWSPFDKGSKLLDGAVFVQERLAGWPEDFLEKTKEHLHPATRKQIEEALAKGITATRVYRDLHARALYTRQANSQFASADREGLDVVVVPSVPEHPTIEAMLADPIALNWKMGAFTIFGNILDLCAVATPAGTYQADDGEGTTLPFGVTFLGARCTDSEVLNIAGRFEAMIQVA